MTFFFFLCLGQEGLTVGDEKEIKKERIWTVIALQPASPAEGKFCYSLV